MDTNIHQRITSHKSNFKSNAIFESETMNNTTDSIETSPSSAIVSNIAIFALSFMLGAMCMIGVPESPAGMDKVIAKTRIAEMVIENSDPADNTLRIGKKPLNY